MNQIMNPNQSDTKKGGLALPAAANLTGLDNSLVKIVNTGGVATFSLATGPSDAAVFVLAQGDVLGNTVYAEQVALDDTARLLFSGNCNPGDKLALNPNSYGQIYKPAGGAGAIYYDWIALEAGAGGTTAVPQLLKVARIAHESVNL